MDTQMNTGDVQKKEGMSAMGPVVGSIIIVLLLAAGGYYFFKMNEEKLMNQSADTEMEADATTEALKQTSDSDTASAIEADLQATDLGNIDAELSDIEASLQ